MSSVISFGCFDPGEFAFDASNLLFDGFELAHQQVGCGRFINSTLRSTPPSCGDAVESAPAASCFGPVGGEVGQFIEVGPVGIEHRGNRGDVHGDASGHDFFGFSIAVEIRMVRSKGKRPSCTSCKVFTAWDGVIGFRNPVAEDHPGGFDLLGHPNFFFPGEQRNGAHLGETTLDGVVAA